MAERCAGYSSFVSSLTLPELREYFPNLHHTKTISEYNNGRHKRGIWVLNKGHFRMVNMTGSCPNFVDGACQLPGGCFLDARKRELEEK